MTSDRIKHTEPSSSDSTSDDTIKARALEAPEREQTGVAAMATKALSSNLEDLMEQIVEEANVENAWNNVRANHGAPGPDGVTLAAFPKVFREQWPTIRQQLLEGTYQPQPARRKSIPKDDGSERHLGIPNIMERLIQQAIMQILTPIFDPGFSESSFGFRPKRSAHGAIKQAQQIIGDGYRYCVDMDLAKFFDTVQHDVLMARVARKVRDKRLLGLIGRYLRAGILVDGLCLPTDEGTMQGGPLSPILANILLDDLDKELEKRGLRFVRYADDFLVFTKSETASKRVYESIGNYLTKKLKLVVNHQKSRTSRTDGIEFLGFQFRGFGGQLHVSPKKIKKFKDRIREITRRNRGTSIKSRLVELRRYAQGWVGYFRLVPFKSFYENLDQWIRRRVRACIWQQWRNPRTRVRNLIKLGVSPREAHTHGNSSKGPWTMSLSKAIHIALSLDYLKELGLSSLLAIWIKLASNGRTA
ncbi:group II intron reverse transcriptase/maturase [Pirellulaceae bacterium SH449]